jgi:hypothetical protein
VPAEVRERSDAAEQAYEHALDIRAENRHRYFMNNQVVILRR